MVTTAEIQILLPMSSTNENDELHITSKDTSSSGIIHQLALPQRITVLDNHPDSNKNFKEKQTSSTSTSLVKPRTSFDKMEQPNLFDPMQLEVRPEHGLQEGYVEQVPTDGVVLRYGVPELHALVVRRPIDPLVVEQVREVAVQETHQPLHVHGRFRRALLRQAEPGTPLRPSAAARARSTRARAFPRERGRGGARPPGSDARRGERGESAGGELGRGHARRRRRRSMRGW